MEKETLKYGFVILHYQALEMTKECVDNLLSRFGNSDIKIVIVDNASPNKSGVSLKEIYSGNKKVIIILSDENSGFAQGNNTGFNYLKDKYEIDFMIVMNNDVIIEQANFLEKVSEIYTRNPFAVLGPSIYAPSIQLYQNPGPLKRATEEQTKKFIAEYQKYINEDNKNYYKLKILHYLVFWWAKPIYKMFFGERKKQEESSSSETSSNRPSTKVDKEVENSVLCGACYIFSKDFVRRRQYAFNPKTFLYFEEQILAYECEKQGLKLLYSPEIEVLHYLNVSSSQSDPNKRKRYMNMWSQNIKSAKIYLDLITRDKT